MYGPLELLKAVPLRKRLSTISKRTLSVRPRTSRGCLELASAYTPSQLYRAVKPDRPDTCRGTATP